jgi:hypothetical protein
MAPAMEKAWFANDKGLIGVVFLDISDQDWNYVVLAPDTHKVYRWVTGNGGIDTQEEAEQALTAEMSSVVWARRKAGVSGKSHAPSPKERADRRKADRLPSSRETSPDASSTSITMYC